MVQFPFEDGSYDTMSESGMPDEQIARVNGCFVDAGIYLSSHSVAEDEWPSIGLIGVSGKSLNFTISCRGSMKSLSVSASGERFPVVSGQEPWGTYFVVLSSEGILGLVEYFESSSSSSSSSSSPPAAGCSSPDSPEGERFFRICAKCVTFMPETLSSIRVFDGVGDRSSGPHFILTGDISMKPGNNMEMSVPDGDNGISMSAVPGAGTGVVNCGCKGNPEYGSSITSPDGHTRIFNDTCYDIEPAEFGTVVVDGEERVSRKLRLHAKCTACCTCDMYESIVNDKLAAIFASVKKAKGDLDGLLASYEDGVSAFNRRIRTPSKDDIAVSLSGMPIGKNVSPNLTGSDVKGKMSRCVFTATVRNNSYFTVSATVQSMSGTDSIVEASASWSDSSGNPKSKTGDTAGSIRGSAFSIYPGRSLVVTFVSVKNAMVGKVATGGFTGSVSFGFTTSRGGLGTISRTVRV